MSYSIQKIKFNKHVKKQDIKKIIRLLNNNTINIKVLKNTNDVEFLNSKYFIKNSYKKIYNPHFTVIIGHLKIEHIQIYGSGFTDIYNTIKNKVSDIFSIRLSFNNKAQAMLKKYGDQKIKNIIIFRAPITASSLLVRVINGLSSSNIPYEKLYHLGLLITVDNKLLRLEKNEVIVFDEMYKLKPATEIIKVPYNKNITLNELLNNTLNKVDHTRIFKYSAFKNNCQQFVKDVLESNDLYNQTLNNFVYQPMDTIIKNLNSIVPAITNTVTNASAYINKLMGGQKYIKKL